MGLKELCGMEFYLVKCTKEGNIFSSNKITCLLKQVNREYSGRIKKPQYYLSLLNSGRSEYLSGLFATHDPSVFSADYLDTIGIKHIVQIAFLDAGKVMKVN